MQAGEANSADTTLLDIEHDKAEMAYRNSSAMLAAARKQLTATIGVPELDLGSLQFDLTVELPDYEFEALRRSQSTRMPSPPWRWLRFKNRSSSCDARPQSLGLILTSKPVTNTPSNLRVTIKASDSSPPLCRCGIATREAFGPRANTAAVPRQVCSTSRE